MKLKVLKPAGASRYQSFLSVGELFEVYEAGVKDLLKVEFLPQWEGPRGMTEAVLSKRALLVDIAASDIQLDHIKALPARLEQLTRLAKESPEELLSIAQAFGRSGTKPGREAVVPNGERLGLTSKDAPSEPTLFWGVVIAIGAALVLAGCCDPTGTDCKSSGPTDPDAPSGSTGGDGSTGGE